MAEIRPFNGIRYNTDKVQDLSLVVCPPYDVISPQQQKELYHRDLHNFVRIEYGKQNPGDTDGDSRYTRAETFLEQWVAEGVLKADAASSIYVDDHYFMHGGCERKRRSIMARIRLEGWHRMVVRPHECTLVGPKSDRISLIRAIKANTSPILSMYEDKQHAVGGVLERATAETPLMRVGVLNGERHDIWAITNATDLHEIITTLADEPLYIADGHHRYESALVYQREQMALYPDCGSQAAFNFVMMTLVAFDDPGLFILPPHRVLRGLNQTKLLEFKQELASFFDIELLALDSAGTWAKVDAWLAAEQRPHLAMFGLDGENFMLLTLRDFETATRFMPSFHSDIYKKLDVSLLDHIIMEELLHIQPESEDGLVFNYDRVDAVQSVQSGDFQLAFIIQPVRPETIKAIADVSDRMPRKSTYFYPKQPSGLVMNRLV
ncbi:MAG: DUF1015 domain-containing protein [Dehalococcoidia bacterium]|nr:DUF1015 domain-containing protein [Dehalococcoidia bacterium]